MSVFQPICEPTPSGLQVAIAVSSLITAQPQSKALPLHFKLVKRQKVVKWECDNITVNSARILLSLKTAEPTHNIYQGDHLGQRTEHLAGGQKRWVLVLLCRSHVGCRHKWHLMAHCTCLFLFLVCIRNMHRGSGGRGQGMTGILANVTFVH